MSDTRTPEERARERAKAWTELLWHVWVFVLVNAFVWTQDLMAGGGIGYAYWLTIPWGLGLLIHAATYFIDSRRLEERKYEQFLARELERERQARERDEGDRSRGGREAA